MNKWKIIQWGRHATSSETSIFPLADFKLILNAVVIVNIGRLQHKVNPRWRSQCFGCWRLFKRPIGQKIDCGRCALDAEHGAVEASSALYLGLQVGRKFQKQHGCCAALMLASHAAPCASFDDRPLYYDFFWYFPVPGPFLFRYRYFQLVKSVVLNIFKVHHLGWY